VKNLSFLFLLFILLFSCSEEKKATKIVGLQALNFFPNFYTDSIASAIKRVYGLPTAVLEKKQLPEQYFITHKSPRYRADSIIRMLNSEMPDSVFQILGLTCVDISTNHKDENGVTYEPKAFYENWAVFGLSNLGSPGSVVSTNRIQGPNQKLVIERIQKAGLHHLGHNLGLKHCNNKNCIMRGAAESVTMIDSVNMKLCDACKKQLH